MKKCLKGLLRLCRGVGTKVVSSDQETPVPGPSFMYSVCTSTMLRIHAVSQKSIPSPHTNIASEVTKAQDIDGAK